MLERRFFSFFSWPRQLLSTSFELQSPGTNIWNKWPKPFHFLRRCISLHRNHLQGQLFSWKGSDSPSGEDASTFLCCWLMFLRLSAMMTPSHNASHLTFLSPSHSQCWAKRGQPSPWPWLTLTQLCIHVKMIWDFHTSDWRPEMCYQFKWQPELPEFANTRVAFTHLQFSLSFSDRPRFCQPWHFSVTMYFSDNLIEGKWNLAPFNSDIAFGSHTDVCHWSFYFGGWGSHRLGRLHYTGCQHKSVHVTLLLATPQWFSIILTPLLPALKNVPELICLLLQNLGPQNLIPWSYPLLILPNPRGPTFCSDTTQSFFLQQRLWATLFGFLLLTSHGCSFLSFRFLNITSLSRSLLTTWSKLAAEESGSHHSMKILYKYVSVPLQFKKYIIS